MNASRLSRCLQLLNLLQSRLGNTVDGLARECGVSKRTIYRDFRLLTEAGVLLDYDEDVKSHVVCAPSGLATVKGVTNDELATLILAARTSCLQRIDSIRSSVNQTISRLLAEMPAQHRAKTLQLLKSCVVESRSPAVEQRVLLILLSAVGHGHSVRITFVPDSKPDELLQTKITPHRLVVSHDECEIIARSSWHREVRSFKLSQIRTAERVEDVFCPASEPWDESNYRPRTTGRGGVAKPCHED